jgi:predicted XRE-type DNA-binding protein
MTMSESKSKRLRKAGWVEGDYGDFLGLSDEDRALVEMKAQLVSALRTERSRRGLTQAQVAKLLGSGQSRVAKMEAGDPSVSIDLLLKALVGLGKTRKEIGKAIAA